MIPNYASDRLAAAVRHMACSSDPLQKRVEAAYLEFHPLIAADFPEELRRKYLDIVSQLTPNKGVRDIKIAMSELEASGIAASIVDLFFEVAAVRKTSPEFALSEGFPL